MSCKKPGTLANLRYLRESKDPPVSQQMLSDHLKARHIDISREALSKYESGERIAKIDTILAIADYFDVSIDYLLGRTEIPTSPDDLEYSANALSISLLAAVNLSGIAVLNGGSSSEIVSDILESPLLSGVMDELSHSKAGIWKESHLMSGDVPQRLEQNCRDMSDMYLMRAVRAVETLLREVLGYNSINSEGGRNGNKESKR